MKRITLFSVVLSFVCVFCASAQKIPYFMPKKVFELTVPYTVVTVQEFGKKDKKPKTAPKIKIILKDEITIVGKVYPDKANPIDLKFLGNAGRSYNLEIGYDAGGNGTITSFNGSQEPVTAEIIKGTVGIVTSVLKIFSGGLFGFAGTGADAAETEEVKTEETFEEKRIIEINSAGTATEYTFQVDIKRNLPVGAILESNPKLKIEFKPRPLSDLSAVNNTDEETSKSILIPTYISRQYDLTATVINNSKYIENQIIIQDVVYVPQQGTLYNIAVPLLKGKRKVELTFSPISGLLTKFNISKTSNSKDIFTESKAGIDELTAAVKELKENQNTAKEEKANKEINDQIKQLKLQNDMLDLLIKKKDFETTLNQKK